MIEDTGDYFKDYVATSLKFRVERVPSGVYAKVRTELIKRFTGTDELVAAERVLDAAEDRVERALRCASTVPAQFHAHTKAILPTIGSRND